MSESEDDFVEARAEEEEEELLEEEDREHVPGDGDEEEPLGK